MSSIQANVVDLVGSPSPLKPMTQLNSHSRINNDRKIASLRKDRRSPRFGNNETSKNDGGNKNAKMPPEIIDLEADTPPSTLVSRRKARKKRPRPLRSTCLEIDDDDIVEIISPPNRRSSSVATAASMKQLSLTTGINWVDRIREVFPLVSRAKVETFLAMARSYSTEDDSDVVFYAVMSVLSEDPRGASVSEATFAAAAVGGRVERGNSTMAPASDAVQSGRRKVAQLECQCCFAEYDYEEMVSCRTGGHLFCKVCLQKHTEQRVFGVGNLGVKPNSTNGTNMKHTSKALEILCMASDCTSGFHEGELRKACSEKVLTKYNELQYAAVIESANIKGIAKCPKCNFIAIADETLPSLLFHCHQCNFKSCKDCGEEYHPNIRCDQVESKNETDGRRVVEEAMTTAMVRTCPRPMCRKKFLKTDGCNKMTCSCGCFICYVCRKEIPAAVAYKHFCQTPHCQHKSCNKCPLYYDTNEADKVRVRDAAKKAARTVKDKVHVDVDAMLKDPPSAQLTRRP
mmetsp:Transcript_43353/g.79340  ORF Transcript_43353/g.79340 Transcript_43353/m.79340 type:complete len:515 (+) Transcript_43353:266-1810(+)|eukprot:CAMPEP_0201881128 /NCGR_PEP_ID=MMETSP0902-20130614/11521_1 /ASSEMBLY_ACC=CAM_ASM_000551 /TAXON_ID=420261 /ORGANISM="Thalassiosira antarctica, Strain CCMP982" /LENGTH=514 /DNA_ID=CAMNT_0048409267 /DNA_START=351 /DNA_END=1895 /DNA_ORIENTATION=-